MQGTEAGGQTGRKRFAVVGSGISGLSAAWLLSQRHEVTVFEQDNRLGGHAHTVDVASEDGAIAVDTGFIVFNPSNYPNLTALFEHLGVETAQSDMSFGVSLDGGALEYGGNGLSSLFAQPGNALSPRYWSMLRDLVRFYKTAPAALARPACEDMTLGDFLVSSGYGAPFTDDHLLPMAGAIWSATPNALKGYPVAAFIRFFENHGLLKLTNRPAWRTVAGGSREYVSRLSGAIRGKVRTGSAVRSVRRDGSGVTIESTGDSGHFDGVLIAAHADQALSMLADPSDHEHALLSQFKYTENVAVMHSDARLMPQRRAVWSSWNYLGQRRSESPHVCVTYWMNRLQPLATSRNIFVTLNPQTPPASGSLIRTGIYTHPLFDLAALRAQRQLQVIQGQRNTWYCGAYFGAGFHEDGLKSGLDAAEQMGGAIRPWHRPAS